MTDNDQNLSFDLHVDGSQAVLGVEGEIDPHTAAELGDQLTALTDRDDLTHVVLDLAAIDFIDSSGLRVILAADAEMRARSATLTVRAPSDAVRRLFEITDLLNHLDID